MVGKIIKNFRLFLETSVIISLFFAIYNQNWTVVFFSMLTVIAIYLSLLLFKRYKVELPLEFEIVITGFIYGSIFLGEASGFYSKFPWWDLMLHGLSGLVLGIGGFLISYILYQTEKLNVKAAFVALFSFTFAVSVGAIWEIFEFSMDNTFGLNMQKNGLNDTMWDLIVDSVGGLFASIWGYFYIKFGKIRFDSVIKNFAQKNPHFFKDSDLTIQD